jgi:hypothetical protein
VSFSWFLLCAVYLKIICTGYIRIRLDLITPISSFFNIFQMVYCIEPVNCPSRMSGKYKLLNKHGYKYYPIRPKIPKEYYHGNSYNSTHIHKYYYIRSKIPQQQMITINQPTYQPTSLIFEDIYLFYTCDICGYDGGIN